VEATAHAPSLELGGLCLPGAQLLLSRAPKEGLACAYRIQLVLADEAESECGGRGARPVWVSANPQHGNAIAAAALARGLLMPALGAHSSLRAEVTHGSSRVDFELAQGGGPLLLEVKSVVCADFREGTGARQPPKYRLVEAPNVPSYRRAALFPVGAATQKLADGTRVVSERAIKHVRELTRLHGDAATSCAVLFVVNRADCDVVALPRGSCKVMPAAFRDAAAAGVRLVALRVRWTEEGDAHFDGMIPVEV
jgi:DNA-binding sugar fermentation-stimulating protein